jgi:serine/threonine-protein kinase
LVREHLAKIIASRNFARSTRLSRFLRFVVEHALNGTSEQVKEYLVGIEVFDRKANYDPRVDPIVRVEARRLRSKLKSYYASEGRADEVLIDFPKGAYIPVFRTRVPATARTRATALETGIVVLPFTNLSAVEDDDYFSDGLTEELIHLLTRVSGLRVVAWHSASQLRGREQDYQGIRDQLKIDRVLRGSVRRTPSRVRVTAQLVDAGSGSYLWSEVYDRDLSDVFSIQQEIARAIVSTLKPALGAMRAEPARTSRNMESYSLYLQGRYHANKRTSEGIRRAVQCFEEAVEIEPDSAVAHAGLADSFSLLADYGIVHPSEAAPKAEVAAMRALELDPQSAEANASLAIVKSLYCWRWAEAEALYLKAIELNPGYAAARHWYGVDLLGLKKRFREAARELDIAIQLDPLSLIMQEGRAFIRMLEGDYEGALRSLLQLAEMDPTFYRPQSSLGRLYTQMGRYREAIEMFERARNLAPDAPNIIGALGQTLAVTGRTADARRCLEDLDRLAQSRYVASTCFAIVHLGLGEFGRSLDWLERACDGREFAVCGIGVHPLYDPLRQEPRFQALLRRIGF